MTFASFCVLRSKALIERAFDFPGAESTYVIFAGMETRISTTGRRNCEGTGTVVTAVPASSRKTSEGGFCTVSTVWARVELAKQNKRNEQVLFRRVTVCD